MVFETFPLSISVCVCCVWSRVMVRVYATTVNSYQSENSRLEHTHTQSVCSLFHFHLENICQCTHASLLFKSIALKLEVFIQRWATLGFHSMNTYFIWYLYIYYTLPQTHTGIHAHANAHIFTTYIPAELLICAGVDRWMCALRVCVCVNQSNLFKIRLGANKNLR